MSSYGLVYEREHMLGFGVRYSFKRNLSAAQLGILDASPTLSLFLKEVRRLWAAILVYFHYEPVVNDGRLDWFPLVLSAGTQLQQHAFL